MKKILSSAAIGLGLIAAYKLLAKDPHGAAKGVKNGVSATNHGADTLGVFFHDLGWSAGLLLVLIAGIYFFRR